MPVSGCYSIGNCGVAATGTGAAHKSKAPSAEPVEERLQVFGAVA